MTMNLKLYPVVNFYNKEQAMKSRLLLGFILTTMFLYTNFSSCMADININEYQSGQEMFSLIIIDYSSNFGLFKCTLNGKITRIKKDNNYDTIKLEVIKVNNTIDYPDPDNLTADVKPFVAEVQISLNSSAPIKIKIVKGKLKDNNNRLSLSMQYRIICGIINLTQKNILKKEIIKNDITCNNLEMKVQYNDQVEIESNKRGKSKDILDLYLPGIFKTYPVIEEGALGGWNIESFMFEPKSKIKYAFFFHDEKKNLITHAVNIKAEAKENIDSDDKYINALKSLGDPKSFEYYQSLEIKIFLK